MIKMKYGFPWKGSIYHGTIVDIDKALSKHASAEDKKYDKKHGNSETARLVDEHFNELKKKDKKAYDDMKNIGKKITKSIENQKDELYLIANRLFNYGRYKIGEMSRIPINEDQPTGMAYRQVDVLLKTDAVIDVEQFTGCLSLTYPLYMKPEFEVLRTEQKGSSHMTEYWLKGDVIDRSIKTKKVLGMTTVHEVLLSQNQLDHFS